MRRVVADRDGAAPAQPAASFSVRYVDLEEGEALAAEPATILGVVGFGTERPRFLPPSCPFIAAPLAPATGAAVVEVWLAAAPCLPAKRGPVIGGYNSDVAFAAVTIDETSGASLETAVELAYLQLFDFLDEVGFAAPLRFWSYLTNITQDEQGLERYRRFNVGRHRAFLARLRQPLPPVASGVGGYCGASVIYCLAAHEPALNIENPRQVSAYAYPPLYGPCSPSFSRASIHGAETATTLLISGTASIVGHETRHVGDLPGQIAETIKNLSLLIDAAEQTAPPAPSDRWTFKVYLNKSEYREVVDRAIQAAFGSGNQRLYLRGELCRPELLVEIEALRQFA